MTQNPYMQGNQFGVGADDGAAQRRTSIMAIVALVLGLLCFIPGLGAIAMIVGGAAIFFISTSRGRLGGLGMAVAGVVLGLIATVLWIAIAVGMSSVASLASQQYVQPAGQLVTGVDTKDVAAVRAKLTTDSNAVISDDEIKAFGDKVRAKMGAYKGPPDGIVGLINAAQRIQSINDPYDGDPDMLPFPADFDNGSAIIVFHNDDSGPGPGPRSTTQNTRKLLFVRNLGLVTADGTEIWLVDHDELQKRLDAKQAPKTKQPG